MTDKQWTKCQLTAPETTTVQHHGRAGEDFRRTLTGRQQLPQSAPMKLPAVYYTRTDIAEARIAELEAERDALQRRIDAAPSVEITACNQIAGASDFDYGDMTEAVAKLKPGQRVALVMLGDDDE